MRELYIIAFFVIYLLTNVLENYLRFRERQTGDEEFGKLWHIVQFTRWVIVFAAITVPLFGLTTALWKTLFLAATLWWLLFDILINQALGRSAFHRSPHSTSILEKIASPVLKFALLAAAVGVYLYV